MKHAFRLTGFPANEFEIETSAWSGKSVLLMDGKPVEQSSEKGKPYLIPVTDGEYVKAFPKQSFPDFTPVLEINGTKTLIAKKLNPVEYILGALPVLLLFIGGAIGGGIGVLATVFNFNIFRQEGPLATKYVKVMGMNIGAFLLYAIVAWLFLNI